MNNNMNNTTPLHDAIYAAKYSSKRHCTTEISNIAVLLAHGANPNVQDIDGRTPLHNIVMKKPFRDYRPGHYEQSEIKYTIIKMLLEYGANPNIQDNNGNTPLHNAIESRPVDRFTHPSPKNIEILLKFGADSNIKNKNTDTPLHYASKIFVNNNEFQIFEMLFDHGANLNTKNIYGETALSILIDRDTCDAEIKKLTQLVRTYNRKIFRLVCEGLKPHNIGLTALLLIGQQTVSLPDKDLIDIIMKCLC